jgi:hypothetical protein
MAIESGVLDAIADTATLWLSGGTTSPTSIPSGYAILGAGVNEVVGNLVLGGVQQPPGTYGSTSSSATFQSDEFFTGTGIITVSPRPVLTITLSTPNVIVSWPTNALAFQLQAVGALGDVWTNDPGTVVVSGTNYTVTEPASVPVKFFRLKR